MKIKPGDKVLITQSLFDGCPNGIPMDDDYYLTATKGSLGVVVTYEEYMEFIINTNIPSLKEYIRNLNQPFKKGIDEGLDYPIKFTFVAAVDYELNKMLGNQITFLGAWRIQLLSPDSFEVISEDEYAKLLRYEEDQGWNYLPAIRL